MHDDIVELLADEWVRIGEVCSGLDESQWKLPSPCPGWTVQDVVAHMVGTESGLLGVSVPDAPESVYRAAHVRNAIGANNEKWIHSMRPLTGAQVLERFVDVTTRRAQALRSMTDADFDVIGWSPIGDVPYRVFMDVRLMDCWVHEQDLRFAIHRPGHRDGPIVERALARFTSALPMTVAKKAGTPDGTVVVFDLRGPSARRIAVAVDGGRARFADADTPATLTITMDTSTWWWLALGRTDRARLTDAAIGFAGDLALGERIVDALAFMI
ncbi:MAG: maleylpyruvate isomerase family mycothiol-dependent enzyme [Acidimicrobiia bacterium]